MYWVRTAKKTWLSDITIGKNVLCWETHKDSLGKWWILACHAGLVIGSYLCAACDSPPSVTGVPECITTLLYNLLFIPLWDPTARLCRSAMSSSLFSKHHLTCWMKCDYLHVCCLSLPSIFTLCSSFRAYILITHAIPYLHGRTA